MQQTLSAASGRMTFELVRIGWPNTGAILALALLPVLAAAAGLGKPHLPAAGLALLASATACPGTGQDVALLAAAGPIATLR
jgi:hypothetical protein